MSDWLQDIRPRLVASRCLGFDAVRYDGGIIESDACRLLFEHTDVIHTCPEVGIGLGTPRPKIRLVPVQDELHLLQPSTNRDLTEPMTKFATAFCNGLSTVDGFVLKSKSPSCGIGTARRYRNLVDESTDGHSDGMFAAVAMQRFPAAAFIDEDTLGNNSDAVAEFLIRIFALAHLRTLFRGPNNGTALQLFHDRYRPLFQYLEPTAVEQLDRDINAVDAAGYRHRIQRLLSETAMPSIPAWMRATYCPPALHPAIETR